MMPEKSVMRPVDRDVIVSILRKLLPANAKVWIFGSRARGSTQRSADLDLAIDIGRTVSFEEQGALEYAFEMSDLPYRVDIIDMSTVHGIFRENVERDRIVFTWQNDT